MNQKNKILNFHINARYIVIPILLSKIKISLSKLGVTHDPLKVKAVAVLGLNVISLGVTVNTGGIDFLEDPKK